jgi:putative cell wall-binding protein
LPRFLALTLVVLLTAPLPATAQASGSSRLAGPDRIGTAAAVSAAHWTSSEHVVVATAAAFPDALAGGPLAADLGAPLLLTGPSALAASTGAEIERLGASRVVLLGGPRAVTLEVERELRNLATRPVVERIHGEDRFATAAAVAGLLSRVDRVTAASGQDFPDALAGGALATGAHPSPTLLVGRHALPDATRSALAELQPQGATLVGGSASVSTAVEDELAREIEDLRRLAGDHRYATSRLVLDAVLRARDTRPIPLVVASGAAFPDALAGAPLAARVDGGFLLVPPRRLTDRTEAYLRRFAERFSGVIVVGGSRAVEDHVVAEIEAALAGEPRPIPPFEGTRRTLPASLRQQMTGSSWRSGCPVGLDRLALLEMTHWGFDGQIHRGRMVVATDVADDVLGAFARIYDEGFPIERMRLIDDYGADDDRSMADNNTSAFNCRRVTGGSSWSEHSYGTALDINPVQNPYVRGSTVAPSAGRDYTDRTDVRPGMIVRPGPVTAAFDRIRWGWGGDWSSVKDYQHFSRSGR